MQHVKKYLKFNVCGEIWLLYSCIFIKFDFPFLSFSDNLYLKTIINLVKVSSFECYMPLPNKQMFLFIDKMCEISFIGDTFLR